SCSWPPPLSPPFPYTTLFRSLLVPSEQRKPAAGARRRRRTVLFGIEDAGRWTLAPRLGPDGPRGETNPEAIEHAARTLLRRYGRSEEHTSELQSRENLVCRLL